jgi:hypothetical protein
MMALGLSLCTILSMSPVVVQAYSYSESSGELSIAYESEIVVPKGQTAKLSVKAKTTDGHTVSYQWNELTETEWKDENGNTLWAVSKIDGAQSAKYSVPDITGYKSYECEVWCDDGSYAAAFEDVYAGEILKLKKPVSVVKTSDKYEENFFVFTPSKDGEYEFLSSGTAEARLYVYDGLTINNDNLISEYDTYYNTEFSNYGGKAVAELSAGHSYAIQAYSGAAQSGSYSVCVQKYAETELMLTTDTQTCQVDKMTGTTKLKVTASVSGSKKASDKITYQWYRYDPVEWDYVPIEGANSASYTVKNSTLIWSENSFLCEAADAYGQNDSIYFKVYRDTGWYASSNGYDERVACGTSATLNLKTGNTQNVYSADGEWIAGEFTEDTSEKTYQWYVLEQNDSYYNGDIFVAIPGADSASYTTGPVTENARYMCVAKDSAGVCDYQQYYVRPVLMDVSVDKTYYSVKSKGKAAVSVKAAAVYENTTFEYKWYSGTLVEELGEDGSVSDYVEYAAVDDWEGKSSVHLSKITETQYLKCEVWAYTKLDEKDVEDYVEIDFVVDPGTGYYKMYTTSEDKNVTGASAPATSKTTVNKDGSVTNVTVEADGTRTETTTEDGDDGTVITTILVAKPDDSKENTELIQSDDGSAIVYTVEKAADGTETGTLDLVAADGSVTEQIETEEVNAEGRTVKRTVTTLTDADGNVTEATEKSVIKKAAANTSMTITVTRDGTGEVTDAAAKIKTESDSSIVVIRAELLSQIREAVGTDVKSVDLAVTVASENGKRKYKRTVSIADLFRGNPIPLYGS